MIPPVFKFLPKHENMESIDPVWLSRLAKRREILIFPRTAGNTGNSREFPGITGKYLKIINIFINSHTIIFAMQK